MKKRITLNSVIKKDLKVVGYLFSFGLGTYLSQQYITDSEFLSLVFGAITNYILFRIDQELKAEGYRAVFKK